MFLRLTYLKNSTFLSLKITVDTLIAVTNETSKHHFLKSVSHITLLSDANVPVRFMAQQRAKYSSPQLKANVTATKMCLRHYIKLALESPTTEDKN